VNGVSREEVLAIIAAEALLLVTTPQGFLTELPGEVPVVFLALLWSSKEEKKSSALRLGSFSTCAGGMVQFFETDKISALSGGLRGRPLEILGAQPDFRCLT
jgi:hypothetical protein